MDKQLTLNGIYGNLEELKKKEFYRIEYPELERIVKKIFPLTEYDFVSSEEANNYSSYEFNRIKKENYPKWNKYDENSWTEFLKENYKSMITRQILEFLVYNNVFPEGDYLIAVYW